MINYYLIFFIFVFASILLYICIRTIIQTKRVKRYRMHRYRYVFHRNYSYLNFFPIVILGLFLCIKFFLIFLNPLDDIRTEVSYSIDEIDISTRIENLSKQLADATAEILFIQQELENRIEYVENLKQEAEIAESVISLSEDQVNAIQAKLNQELATNNNKSLYQSILINVIFFILGCISSLIIDLLKSKFNKSNKLNNIGSPMSKYSDEQISMALQLIETAINIDNNTISNTETK